MKDLQAKGYEPVLTKSRWLLLKRPEHLMDSQENKLSELLQYNATQRASVFTERGLPAVLELSITLLGRTIFGQVVYEDDTFKD